MTTLSLDHAIAKFLQVGALFSVDARRQFAEQASQGVEYLMAHIHHTDVIAAFREGSFEKPNFEAFSGHSFGDSESAFNPVFHRLIDTVRPRLVIEVGTWFGTSAVIMATRMKQLGIKGKILCVDDFNGWPPIWKDSAFPRTPYGKPLIYEAYLQRILDRGLEDYIIPVPTTSSHAYWYFTQMGMQADLIYIDATHDERSVSGDLLGYYACMRDGGLMFGDDYTLYRYGYHPVKTAVDRFAQEWDLPLHTHDEKWVIEARMPFLKDVSKGTTR